MDTTQFPSRKHIVSRIGLGCGRIVGGASFSEGAQIVEAALSAGITYFDLAPSYGLGLAEAVVGRVTKGQDVTLVTKAGIGRPRHRIAKSIARRVLKPFVGKAPTQSANLASLAGSGESARNRFTPQDLEVSLSGSLKELRRTEIDALLLHEPRSATPPAVQETLHDLVTRGLIGAYGAGTGQGLESLPALGAVRQYRWSPGLSASSGETHIRHGLLRYWLTPLQTAIENHPLSTAELSDALDFDLADRGRLPALLLSMALHEDRNGIVLVSSREPRRIREMIGGIAWSAVRGEQPKFTAISSELLSRMSACASEERHV